MPKPPSLPDDFYAWGRPKLRPLNDARAADQKAGVKRYGEFHKLLEQYLSELETLPFAQPDFEDYQDEDGEPTLNAEEILERASSWLRNHSRFSGTVQISKFEGNGGVSEASATRVTSAAEMWAEGEKARIRKATCEALGIPVTTGNNALPSEWIGARKSVVKQEFASLPQEDQDEWHALASRERDAAAKERLSVITVQERQLRFPGWLDAAVAKQTKARALGDVFVFQFSGYCVRAEDKQLERFRGQISSDPTTAKWFQSDAYAEVVGPAWTEFLHKDVGDRLLFKLKPPPPAALTGEALEPRRAELAQYLEEMFRIDCDFAKLDEQVFWKAVRADPTKFVHPDRLPNQIAFENPERMPEDDFRQLFRHLWRCQNKPEAVDRDERFVYEHEGIREFITLERKHHLRTQQRRRASATQAAGADGAQATNTSAPPVMQTSDAVPLHDADITASPRSSEPATRTPAEDVVGPAEATSPRSTTPTPRATPSGTEGEDAQGAQALRASPDSKSTTPASPGANERAISQPTTAPGRRKAATRSRSGAKAQANTVPAPPKGRKNAAASEENGDESEADPTPPKAQKAKAAPKARKRNTKDRRNGEDEREEAQPKKGKAAPRPRKRPAADDDDEEYSAEPSPKSKAAAARRVKKPRVEAQPAATKPRTRRGAAKK